MADPVQFSATELLGVLAVSGLLGMVGQGARTVAGLKKLNDLADSTRVSSADLFLASRLVVSMIIGFIAGVVAALSVGVDKLLHFNSDNIPLLMGIAAAGYIGADFIEAFTRKLGATKAPDVPEEWRNLPEPAPVPSPVPAPVPAPDTPPRILRGDGSFSFAAEVVGNDIAVRNVTATWFGGPNDPSDSGQTASGISTRNNPTLMGCSLPMDGFRHPKTDGSPIPRLPWNTMVRVKNLKTQTVIDLPLIDLGPSKFAGSHAAIDLTETAFRSFGVNPSAGIMKVDYTVLGGARFVRDGAPGSSLNKPENRDEDLGPILNDPDPDHGPETDVQKPPIKQFIRSPNFSSRNGRAIDMIVLHYTAGATAQGAINTFLTSNNGKRTSAHYIIERNGDIYQMVEDRDKAWHARDANPRSIGIEHVAVTGQRMSMEQERSSVALIRWLMQEYGIKKRNITGHRFAPGNSTICPDHLFGEATKQALDSWVDRHFG